MRSYKEILELHDEFNSLMKGVITEANANRAIQIIKLLALDDDEVAHSYEDQLRAAVLRTIGGPLAELALSTDDIEFCRWYA